MSDSDVQYRSYLGHVRSKIDAVWEYPPAARDNGLNGVVTVRFTITRNGRLEALIVKNKSRYQLLDDEACERSGRLHLFYHPVRVHFFSGAF